MGVWDKLHYLFDTDDGSLPEVRVTKLSPEGVAAVVDFIRSRSTANLDGSFWHRILDREERLSAYPNPARLVATGEAEPFHWLASGLSFGGVVLPDLGVFVFQYEVALDYRMGSEWGEAQVLGLFELLRQLAALDPNARIRLDRHVLPKVEQEFLCAWSEYCKRGAA